jgi:hypothetical protein
MQLLDDFIDGELPGNKRPNVEQHIRECGGCGREAEFMRCLSRDAASLPKEIQPIKDLWPGIEAEITAVSFSKSGRDASKVKDLERKWKRHKTAALAWRIAAAALLATILLAGTYLILRKYNAENEKQTLISNAPEKKTSGITTSPSSRSVDRGAGAITQDKAGNLARPDIQAFGSHPPSGIVTYSLDLSARAFVSNYGIFAVRQDRDPVYLAVSRNFILGFDRSGTKEWASPLPPGSTLLSVYPGGGNRLWASYEVEEPEFQVAIAELYFGVDSQIRNIWTSFDLHVSAFVVSPQGLIYAAGFPNDFSKTVAKLKRGQSITAELLHIIDPKTDEERNLFPITLTPKFNSQLWAGQTVLEMTNLANQTVISIKSNGNFFVTIDQTSALASVRGLIKNEAVEYSPDGTIAATWDLGDLEPDAYLNKIFVDIDDSILAEIIRYADTGASDSPNEALIERYLLRIDPSGRVTHCDPGLYSNEAILGWIGQTEELVTVGDTGTRQQQVGIRKLPF